LEIFSPNFTHLLYVPIYATVQIFIQLPTTLTKLRHIKCDHPATSARTCSASFKSCFSASKQRCWSLWCRRGVWIDCSIAWRPAPNNTIEIYLRQNDSGTLGAGKSQAVYKRLVTTFHIERTDVGFIVIVSRRFKPAAFARRETETTNSRTLIH